VFAAIHGLAHPGIRATRRLVSSRFVWRGCAANAAGWCRNCQTCQRGKVTRQPAAATKSIPGPERRFMHLHVDLVGPRPTSAEGFKYLFTIIDRSTRWVEAISVKNIEAATIVDALVAGWVSRFGVPAVITSDRGTQFTSAVWGALCNRLHIQHITTTAFHPCSNGMVERCHRQLKEALRARSAANDLPDHLPWVLLGLRAAPKEDSAISSEIVLGDPLVLPGQPPTAGELPPPQRSYRDALLGGPTRHVPTRPLPPAHSGLPAALAACTSVYIRRGGVLLPFAPLYAGPYTVLERGEKVFRLQVGDREEAVASSTAAACGRQR
jgi:transposase InsO family protein